MENDTTDWESEIVSLLEDLSSTQEEMLDVLTQKRDMMASADAEGMSNLQERESELHQQLLACHDRRGQLLSKASENGLPSDSVQTLASHVERTGLGKLGKQVKNASSRMRLLQHHSLTNWVLAQRTLLHLSQILEIIATGGQLQPTYSKGEAAQARGSLVDKAA